MSAANPVGASVVTAGRYRLGERLGRGASAETFAAVDEASGAPRAVKLFAAGLDAGRAIAEFRRLQALDHPGLVKVHDVGVDERGQLFVVMDLVAGPALASIARGPDEAARRRAFERAARGLADAVAYLHAREIVHADICAANVRLDGAGAPVLLDFGLAARLPSGGGTVSAEARGTLGYAAPEALIGQVAPAADLFSLGATLFEAWAGAPPFGVGLPAVQRMLSAPAPRLSAIRGGLAVAWDDILARLLAARPQDRYPSAREALRDIARAIAGEGAGIDLDLQAPFPGGDPLGGVVVGRTPELTAVRLLVDRLAEGSAPAAVAAIVGTGGSGRRTVIEGGVREAAIARAAGLLPPFVVWRGNARALERELLGLPAPADGDGSASDRGAALAEALEAKATTAPLCLVLDGGAGDDALARVLAGAPPSGNLLALLPTTEPIAGPFAQAIAIQPLDAAAIAALARAAIGQEAPPDAVARIVGASGGHAATAAVLARSLALAMREGRADVPIAETAADLGQLLARVFADLPAGVRRWLAALALFGGARPERLSGTFGGAAGGDMAALARRAGWLAPGAEPQLPSAVHQQVIEDALGQPELRPVAEAAIAELPGDDVRRAVALAALGRGPEAARGFRAAAAPAARAGDAGRAATWLRRAETLAPGTLEIDERLTLVTGLAELGRYGEAERALRETASPDSDSGDRWRVEERRAWLQGRQGRTGEAIATLHALLASSAASGDGPDRMRARLGRLLVGAGRFDEAAAVLEPMVGSPAATASAIEAAVLAHAYGGRLARARRLLEQGMAAPDGAPARWQYLGALLDQMDGRLRDAAAGYTRARALAAARGDVHTEATVALNLAAVLAEQGRYGDALAASDRAVRLLGRLGATAELGTALLNAANLFVLLGEPGSARRAIGRVRDEGAARGSPVLPAYARFVEGDLLRRQGERPAAVAAYGEAQQRLTASGQARAARQARLAEAETLAESGRLPEARAALADARAGDPRTAPAEPELDIASARLLLADPALDIVAGDVTALAGRLQRHADSARAETRLPAAWRAALLAARLLNAAGDTAARRVLADARRDFQEVRMATPENHQVGLDADPDARWLAGPAVGAPSDAALALRAARNEDRLRRLLRINKRLNSELRLPRLLDTILDTVIELTDAERGFILLEDDAGELMVRAARNIDQRTLETAEFELSRSIARRAAAGGGPIITVDAAGDERFKEAMSVSDLHLRSVLAVPLQIKGRAAGTIYVDHRLRKGAFGDDDVALVLDFAEQAAIAIENARLLAEVRRRERQVAALNGRLEVELAARREELTGMKQELRETREALAIRYDYRNIVGRTPRMLELFRLLDRLTDTALPVVIQGESGTGKELVARAIHFNGPRRERPFVSENCAAIPETLLESALFGYVRGAFTGAEHDTRGLFEIADGGTLFLDEIAEMSPAMQGKLLRVLQQGEFRRVGGDRTRKVDVRIVAATNRDLARMVEEGKFRQDLFFRLNVAGIFLPPLRDRREDIPLIVEHFLARQPGGVRKPLDPPALARLCAYRWPGNVRELENELLRAVALSGERVTVGDLSPPIAAAGDTSTAGLLPDDPDSLHLRRRVERLERSLVREALARCGNNQTKAAATLGLSRFGLQKKLKRYGLA